MAGNANVEASKALAVVRTARLTIEKLGRERAELEGRRKQLVSQLQTEFSVDTVEAASTLMTQMDMDLSALETELKAGVEKINTALQAVEK
jgi:hypothetical protein